MDILGIGLLELLFILLIALIVLGPNDMVKAGRTLGRFLRKVVTSPTWLTVQQASRDLRYLPNKLIREAGLEELEELENIKKSLPEANEIRQQMGMDAVKEEMTQIEKEFSEWTTPPTTINSPTPPQPAPTSQPPSDGSDQTPDQTQL